MGMQNSPLMDEFLRDPKTLVDYPIISANRNRMRIIHVSDSEELEKIQQSIMIVSYI